MRRLFRSAVAALLVAGAACSGSGDDAAPSTSTTAQAQPATSGGGWTVLQYHMADTDLEPFMMDDVNEMGAVGSNDNLDIVAMVDRSPDYGEAPVLDLGDWVGAKVLHILPGHAELLQDLGPTDMSDPATLAAFITEGITSFPAAHYALILNDHGASWPGVGSDESADGSTMDLAEIHSAVATGLADAGVDRLDLLGFDACLMATYEVATTIAPLADRMVASSELEPGHGWDYHSLQVLADDPNATADDVGTAFVDSYLAEDDVDGTMALLDLTQMAALDEAMAMFTSALVDRAATVAPDVGRTLEANPGYGKSPDPSQDAFMTDLGMLVATIGVEALDVSDPADTVQRASTTWLSTRCPVLLPPTSRACRSTSRRRWTTSTRPIKTSLTMRMVWLEFLDAYFVTGAAIPSTELPAFTSEDSEITLSDDGLDMTNTVEPASVDNLSGATIRYGVENEDGSTTFFGDETAEIADDGSGLVTGFYDLTVLHITDGVDTATAYISLSKDDESGGFSLEVPMAYFSPDDVSGETLPGRAATHRRRQRLQRDRRDLLRRRPRFRHVRRDDRRCRRDHRAASSHCRHRGQCVVDPNHGRRPLCRPFEPAIQLRAARPRYIAARRALGHRLRRQHGCCQHGRRGAVTDGNTFSGVVGFNVGDNALAAGQLVATAQQ